MFCVGSCFRLFVSLFFLFVVVCCFFVVVFCYVFFFFWGGGVFAPAVGHDALNTLNVCFMGIGYRYEK